MPAGRRGEVRIVEHTPDHDLGSITRYARQMAAELQQRHPGLPIDLNASGGTKVMSFGFVGAFAGLGDAWYCDTRHGLLEHLGGAAALELPADMLKLGDLLQMQGYRVVADPTWSPGFACAAAARAGLTERLVREAPQLNGFFGYVNRLTREALTQSRPDGSIVRPFRSEVIAERALFRNNHELAEAFAQAGIWHWDGDCRFLFASEAAARYVGGGWLEEWAWLTLAGLQADGLIPDGHWATNVRIDAGRGCRRPRRCQDTGGRRQRTRCGAGLAQPVAGARMQDRGPDQYRRRQPVDPQPSRQPASPCRRRDG
jgi:hypothetical protein